jgi:hypothetical protein
MEMPSSHNKPREEEQERRQPNLWKPLLSGSRTQLTSSKKSQLRKISLRVKEANKRPRIQDSQRTRPKVKTNLKRTRLKV